MLKAALWPLVALVALFMFGEPIKDQFLAGNISRVKVGILELNMKQSELPSVSDINVASGLVDLPESGVVILLFTDQNGFTQCSGNQDLESFDEETSLPLMDLESRGLVTLKEYNGEDGKCFDIELTDNGKTARRFVTDLIAAQLKSANTN